MKLTALLLALCCSGLFAQELPPAPKAHLTDVTPKPGYFNEPAIAVNPKNPRQMVAAWQVNASVAYSQDGGVTWTTAEGTAPKEYKISGDVSVTYDAAGRAILCYIAFDKLGTTSYWAHGATRNGIFIRRSPDGGQTWEPEAMTVIAHDSTPGIPFEDKPWIVADTAGPHAGNLYIGWTHFTLTSSELFFVRSTDGGKTWSTPLKLNSVSGLPRDDNGALEGFHGVAAPDGTLYTAWSSRDGIMMAVSRDGGATFTKDRLIIPTGPSYFSITGVLRSNGFPQIGIDRRLPKSGAFEATRGGKLYVAWSDYSNGDVDVFVAWSLDHGRTWSAPVRVNTDPIHNGNDQFFQWMAIDPQSGAVNLIFYDRRRDNLATTVTLARSTDGGNTFQNYTWDSESFDAEGDFLGDYLGITAFGDKVFGAWAHQTQEEVKTERGKRTRTVLRVGTADFN
ncbi:MAG TPA: sialidase family protein [Candidatus Angelobacter sp.]|nr:sialidase family protein [Candidatus Angelobacter sp.]